MCVSPLIKKLPTASRRTGALTQPVPCGKCPLCIKSRVGGWTFRLNQELSRSTSAYFVTLTYDEQHVPYTNNQPPFKDYKTLRKKDVQDFLKRLRKRETTTPIKYYACGEYGSRTKRPHYHLLMFNVVDVQNIQKAWQNGFTYTLPLQNGAVPYVLKYMAKTSTNATNGRQKEFSLMSKRLGDNYITPQTVYFHTSRPENSFVTLDSGATIALPKYFKEKIYDNAMRMAVTEYQRKRIEQVQSKHEQNLNVKYLLKNTNSAANLLSHRKLHTTFDVRQNEVL